TAKSPSATTLTSVGSYPIGPFQVLNQASSAARSNPLCCSGGARSNVTTSSSKNVPAAVASLLPTVLAQAETLSRIAFSALASAIEASFSSAHTKRAIGQAVSRLTRPDP